MSVAASVLFGDSSQDFVSDEEDTENYQKVTYKAIERKSKRWTRSSKHGNHDTSSSEVGLRDRTLQGDETKRRSGWKEETALWDLSCQFRVSEEQVEEEGDADSPDSVIIDTTIPMNNKRFSNDAFGIENTDTSMILQSFAKSINLGDHCSDLIRSTISSTHQDDSTANRELACKDALSAGENSEAHKNSDDDCSITSIESPPFPELSFNIEPQLPVFEHLPEEDPHQKFEVHENIESLYQEMMNVGDDPTSIVSNSIQENQNPKKSNSSSSSSSSSLLGNFSAHMSKLSENEVSIQHRLSSLLNRSLHSPHVPKVSFATSPKFTPSAQNNTVETKCGKVSSTSEVSPVSSTIRSQPSRSSPSTKKRNPKSDPVALFHAVEKRRLRDKKALEIMRKKKLQQAKVEHAGLSVPLVGDPSFQTELGETTGKTSLSAWAKGSIGPPGLGLNLNAWEGGLRRTVDERKPGKRSEARETSRLTDASSVYIQAPHMNENDVVDDFSNFGGREAPEKQVSKRKGARHIVKGTSPAKVPLTPRRAWH